MQLTEVQKDVVQAYSDWMEQKKQEIQDYFNSPDTPKHYKDAVVSLFSQLDKDGSGIVQVGGCGRGRACEIARSRWKALGARSTQRCVQPTRQGWHQHQAASASVWDRAFWC